MRLPKHAFQPMEIRIAGTDEVRLSDWCAWKSEPRPSLDSTSIAELDFCWKMASNPVHQVEEAVRDDA